MKNKLCERVERAGVLHIYINSDKFTNENNTLVASYDDKELAYSINLKSGEDIGDCIDWFMGHIGRDTQNWFNYDIIIHWGINEWKFYNSKNISDFTKDNIEYFDLKDYDIE